MMQTAEFEFISRLIKRHSGLALKPDKTYLLESRLLPIARQAGMDSVNTLIAHLRQQPNSPLLASVVDAMTTNESSFFRDGRPFEHFRQLILPQVIERNAASKRIRIWSSACSTGQEPYTIALCLQEEMAKLQGWTLEIVATDISDRVLDKAKIGMFTQFEVQRGLPVQHLVRYFDQVPEGWKVKPLLRTMVNFRQMNLLDDYTLMGKFDVVFCRNVLIYFDEQTKADIVTRMGGVIQPGGFFFIGSTESMLGINTRFQGVPGCSGIYQLQPL